MVESRASAEAYLRDKNIGQIFAELGTSLLYHKPADPRQHLIQELEKMKRKAPPTFFAEDDLRSVFKTMDPTAMGTISSEQAKTAMRSMGLTSIPDDIDDRLNVGTFVRIAKEAIQTDRIL